MIVMWRTVEVAIKACGELNKYNMRCEREKNVEKQIPEKDDSFQWAIAIVPTHYIVYKSILSVSFRSTSTIYGEVSFLQ